MKNKLTIRLALLIVCALNINTTFAQDVRQNPVVKKQTTTTKKQSSASTKQSDQATNQKWKEVGRYSEGLARVQDDNDKCGFIDKTGKLVIPCQWKFAWDFYKGLAEVQDANDKRFKIDKTGKVVK